jgi:hypothetical protein
MQGRIDTGAHDKHLISHAKETNKLGQNLVRAMDEGFEANAHRWVVLNEIAARAYFPHKPRENTEKQI